MWESVPVSAQKIAKNAFSQKCVKNQESKNRAKSAQKIAKNAFSQKCF
jgi:hypothetical protein